MQEMMSPGMSCLAGLLFAVAVTVLPLWLVAYIKERRDRPYRQRRDELTRLAFQFGAALAAQSFAVHTDKKATKAYLLLVDGQEENVAERMQRFLADRGWTVGVEVTGRTSEQMLTELKELSERRK